MKSTNQTARLAGLLYLIVVLSGVFSLMYVPSQLIAWDNAAATVSNITASELLFRLGIVGSIICYSFFLFLPLALYQLLKPVDKTQATLMVILALLSVPISFINLGNKLDVLALISSADSLKAIGTDQLHAQVMLALKSYNNGILVVSTFWGLWLFPFGYLVYNSGFLPKVLGILLMAGCIGYLIDMFGTILYPQFGQTLISTIVTIPSGLGEIGICLWLLIMGTKHRTITIADNKSYA